MFLFWSNLKYWGGLALLHAFISFVIFLPQHSFPVISSSSHLTARNFQITLLSTTTKKCNFQWFQPFLGAILPKELRNREIRKPAQLLLSWLLWLYSKLIVQQEMWLCITTAMTDLETSTQYLLSMCQECVFIHPGPCIVPWENYTVGWKQLCASLSVRVCLLVI